jgi:CheY-like chemotaxis protein
MSAPDGRLDGVKVLVVDDTPDSLEVMALMLKTAGATVLTASSASDAFRVLEREAVRVLVTDIGMPTSSGYDLLRWVRVDRPDHNGFVPAIAVTGFASADDRRRVLEAGFRAHLAKPVDSDELIAVVARLAAE